MAFPQTTALILFNLDDHGLTLCKKKKTMRVSHQPLKTSTHGNSLLLLGSGFLCCLENGTKCHPAELAGFRLPSYIKLDHLLTLCTNCHTGL